MKATGFSGKSELGQIFMHSFILPACVFFSCLMAAASWGGQAPMNLTGSEKELLLRVARSSIEAHLKGRSPTLPEKIPAILNEPHGVFVTLHRHGRLRGCIGYLEAVKPLINAVQDMAVAAAFRDPRFPPLREDELADIDLEISVLSPMRRVFKVEEIEVGKHGLYIERALARGLLLPQVATEHHWNRTTFLEQTCVKAGLPPSAWRDPESRIYVFSAEIFSEQPPKSASPQQEPKTR
jgi:AmmeMemoRadiSam system protein A